MATRAVRYKIDAVVVPTVTPFVHALKPRFTGRGCDWCYVRTTWHGALLKQCARCHLANYCSKECQKEDWDNGGHKHECKLFRKPGAYKDIDDGQLSQLSWSRIAIRMALKLGFDPTLMTKTFKRYDGQEVTWESLPVQGCPELALRRNMDQCALWLLTEYFPEKADIWRVVTKDLMAKLSMHTLTVPNPHGLWDLAMAFYWEAVGVEKVENPNAVAVYVENRLKVVAKRDIRANEKISIALPPTASNLLPPGVSRICMDNGT